MKETQAVHLPTYKLKSFHGQRRPRICKKAGIEMIPAFIYALGIETVNYQ